jgi:hypothetical protein
MDMRFGTWSVRSLYRSGSLKTVSGGPKRDEVTGGWRKLHNEELHGLYSSPIIVRVIKARRMRWIHLAQDRDRWWAVVNTIMNLRVP